jgi:trehalose 6-phosphate synthase
MRLFLRFAVPLLIILTLMAYITIPVVDRLTVRLLSNELSVRSQMIGTTVKDPLLDYVKTRNRPKINKLFNRMIEDKQLYAVGYLAPANKFLYKTNSFPTKLLEKEKPLPEQASKKTISFNNLPLYVVYQPMFDAGSPVGHLVFIHDMSFIQKRSETTKKYLLYFFIFLGTTTSAITVCMGYFSRYEWVKNVRSMIKGGGFSEDIEPELFTLSEDLKELLDDVAADQKGKEDIQTAWTPAFLKEILRREFSGDDILIISNRQPYIHNKKNDGIEIHRPASGLVTGLEPIMKACSGTWIAHGNGSGDRESVDEHDRFKVVEGNHSYFIRRVWLSAEQEEGYYLGFSNEGLWPLCHIAHTRPIFRASDWKQYVAVNQLFADAVVQESKADNPVILVQDYHFALLPKLIKEKLPNATVITFWHIPWPNPEAFSICPWRNEILEGLLGSDILGFHTRYHCNNFIDTADRFIECRIDHDSSSISYKKKTTAINHYPISIDPQQLVTDITPSVESCKEAIYKLNHFPPTVKLGIGVDRLDYTKGILERFLAIERFLDLFPEWVGRFVFVQIAAPSRSSIPHYQQFEAQVLEMAARINQRFSTEDYQPICLKVEHHNKEQVSDYYRAADVCLITVLHDGMNLVAKEFISCRDDNKGVLILSQFAGASKELAQALVVNPYDIDQCAGALKVALEMSDHEQRGRMQTMRSLIEEFNIYRWAGKMLIDAAHIRQHEKFVGEFGNAEDNVVKAVQEQT